MNYPTVRLLLISSGILCTLLASCASPRDLSSLDYIEGVYICPESKAPFSGRVKKTLGVAGRIQAEGFLQNGKKDGIWTRREPNPGNRTVTRWRNGVKEGLQKRFEGGSTVSETVYVNGKKSGESLQWYPGGQLKEEAFFVDGVVTGKIKRYFSNGRISEVMEFGHGMLNGHFSQFNTDGFRVSDSVYRNDVQLLSEDWSPAGEHFKCTYSEGKPYSGTTRGEYLWGQILFPGHGVKDETCFAYQSYKNGKLHGLQLYYCGKRILCAGVYRDGNMHSGVLPTMIPEQSLGVLMSYSQGKPDGPVLYFHPQMKKNLKLFEYVPMAQLPFVGEYRDGKMWSGSFFIFDREKNTWSLVKLSEGEILRREILGTGWAFPFALLKEKYDLRHWGSD